MWKEVWRSDSEAQPELKDEQPKPVLDSAYESVG